MFRKVLALAILFVTLFSGCRGEDSAMQTALDFRGSLLSAGGCRFTADVEADFGERIYDFTLECTYNGTDGTLNVTAPKSIAGISATVSDGSSELEFDGVSLDFGPLANGFASPLSLPWLLGSAWTGDYIAWAGRDGDLAYVTWLKGYQEQELSINTWFQKNIPVRAEVLSEGRRVLTVTIEDFALAK